MIIRGPGEEGFVLDRPEAAEPAWRKVMGNEERRTLPGYVGVKFDASCRNDTQPRECAELHALFLEQGQKLGRYGMAPANGGNMSIRLQQGFSITSSGCNLDDIEPDDIVWVHACDPDREEVHYGGPRLPSSESILHHMIYEARADSRCVIHAHDPVATSTTMAGLVPESAREEPYGTVALARIAIETFRRDRCIILLRNHGYVATGDSLEAVANTIVELHLRLLECSR